MAGQPDIPQDTTPAVSMLPLLLYIKLLPESPSIHIYIAYADTGSRQKKKRPRVDTKTKLYKIPDLKIGLIV